ncbi:40S ribosomal protein S25 [Candidatus Bathyarchaeota archaeon]|nr:40S ribosomal protein S25 [Candidatus Bathyarchaeota archaeon]
MGGKKRPTISQAEKAQRRREEEARRELRRKLERSEKKILDITPPDIKDEKVLNEIKRMKVITPFSIASKYEVRMSIAKQFLENLHRKGIIELVSKNGDLRIYRAR